MSREYQKANDLKKKISDVVTLLTEAETLVKDMPEADSAIKTSLTFISKSAIDLSFQVYDHAKSVGKKL